MGGKILGVQQLPLFNLLKPEDVDWLACLSWSEGGRWLNTKVPRNLHSRGVVSAMCQVPSPNLTIRVFFLSYPQTAVHDIVRPGPDQTQLVSHFPRKSRCIIYPDQTHSSLTLPQTGIIPPVEQWTTEAPKTLFLSRQRPTFPSEVLLNNRCTGSCKGISYAIDTSLDGVFKIISDNSLATSEWHL